MSEIKGQLLGIVLTVALFGIVSAALVVAFQNTSKKVAEEVEKNTVEIPKASTENFIYLHY